MIRHLVLMRFNPGTTDEQRDAIAAGIRALAGKIPELVDISCGPDAGLAEGNADFASVADFADEAGYLVYATHPAHVQVITELIRPVLAQRTAVQYEVVR
jgi:hypothetical protein